MGICRPQKLKNQLLNKLILAKKKRWLASTHTKALRSQKENKDGQFDIGVKNSQKLEKDILETVEH